MARSFGRAATGLLDNMRRLAREDGLWQKIGTAAARDVRENFEHSAQIARLERIYDEAVETGAAGQ